MIFKEIDTINELCKAIKKYCHSFDSELDLENCKIEVSRESVLITDHILVDPMINEYIYFDALRLTLKKRFNLLPPKWFFSKWFKEKYKIVEITILPTGIETSGDMYLEGYGSKHEVDRNALEIILSFLFQELKRGC